MSQVKERGSRRCDCCVEPWKNAYVGAPIVVVITKIAGVSVTIQNVIYVEKSTSLSSPLCLKNNYWCATGVITL